MRKRTYRPTCTECGAELDDGLWCPECDVQREPPEVPDGPYDTWKEYEEDHTEIRIREDGTEEVEYTGRFDRYGIPK